MSKKLVGKEKIDYFSKKKGEQVTGLSLHIIEEKKDDASVEGLFTSTVWIGKASPLYDQCLAIPVNSEINVYYNNRGYVDSVVPCQK